jgi:hypothetical protein
MPVMQAMAVSCSWRRPLQLDTSRAALLSRPRQISRPGDRLAGRRLVDKLFKSA